MKILDKIIKISKVLKEDKIFIYSSHASFYMIISSIPFITIFISIIQAIISVTEYDISSTLLPFLPLSTQDTAQVIIEEIFNKDNLKLISLSAVSLLWTASRGLAAVRRGLYYIYNIPNLPFCKDVITAVGWVFPLIFSTVLLLFTSVFVSVYLSIIPKAFIGIILLSVLFTLIYYVFTERKIKIKYHILGSFLASVSWIIFIRLFSFYIENFSNYSYVYGSLTAILLLALWIYFSIIILLLGAEVNKLFYSNKKRTVL